MMLQKLLFVAQKTRATAVLFGIDLQKNLPMYNNSIYAQISPHTFCTSNFKLNFRLQVGTLALAWYLIDERSLKYRDVYRKIEDVLNMVVYKIKMTLYETSFPNLTAVSLQFEIRDAGVYFFCSCISIQTQVTSFFQCPEM